MTDAPMECDTMYCIQLTTVCQDPDFQHFFLVHLVTLVHFGTFSYILVHFGTFSHISYLPVSK